MFRRWLHLCGKEEDSLIAKLNSQGLIVRVRNYEKIRW
jgi:hypothetical protein